MIFLIRFFSIASLFCLTLSIQARALINLDLNLVTSNIPEIAKRGKFPLLYKVNNFEELSDIQKKQQALESVSNSYFFREISFNKDSRKVNRSFFRSMWKSSLLVKAKGKGPELSSVENQEKGSILVSGKNFAAGTSLYCLSLDKQDYINLSNNFSIINENQIQLTVTADLITCSHIIASNKSGVDYIELLQDIKNNAISTRTTFLSNNIHDANIAAPDNTVSLEFQSNINLVPKSVFFNNKNVSKSHISECADSGLCTHKYELVLQANEFRQSKELNYIINLDNLKNIQNTEEEKIYLSQPSSKELNFTHRFMYGITDEEKQHLNDIGLDAFIEEQFSPELVENESFEAAMKEKYSLVKYVPELRHFFFERLISTKAQLREKMARFWDNHFSTNANVPFKAYYPLLTHFSDGSKNPTLDPGLGDHFTNERTYSVRLTEEALNFFPSAESFAIDFYNLGIYSEEEIAIIELHYLDQSGQGQVLTYDYTYVLPDTNPERHFEITIPPEVHSGTIQDIVFSVSNLPENEVRTRKIALKNSQTELLLYGSKYEFKKSDYEFYRNNAFGNFSDLVKHSSQSISMLNYLDNAYSDKEQPNQNYARELMELHTLGVNAGYNDEDISNVSRLLTGVSFEASSFAFKPEMHDTDPVNFSLLNKTYDNAGYDSVLEFLDDISKSSYAAEFICNKLITKFVSEEPVENLTNSCKTVFLNNVNDNKQIEKVLKHLISSQEFSSQQYSLTKVTDPMIMFARNARTVQSSSSDPGLYIEMNNFLNDNGFRQFDVGPPTGVEEDSQKWMSNSYITNSILLANNYNLAVDYLRKLDGLLENGNSDCSSLSSINFQARCIAEEFSMPYLNDDEVNFLASYIEGYNEAIDLEEQERIKGEMIVALLSMPSNYRN